MKAIDKAKSFLKKYRHAWVLSYFLQRRQKTVNLEAGQEASRVQKLR